MPTNAADSAQLKFIVWMLGSARRARFFRAITAGARWSKMGGVDNETRHLPRQAGRGTIRTRIYRPKEATEPLPIVVFYHGGGQIAGMPEHGHLTYQRLMETRPCVIVAPAYQLALDAPYPAGLNDCYNALLWAQSNAAEIGGDPTRIVIAGESAGGGLALGVALRARAEGRVKPAFQMPFYPMIDDRRDTWTDIGTLPNAWTAHHNKMAWDMILRGVAPVPDEAAPGRATDVAGLPPTLSFIGDQDVFLDQTQSMMKRLEDADVPVTFEVFKDAFHGHEVLATDTQKAADMTAFFKQGFAQMMDRYCAS